MAIIALAIGISIWMQWKTPDVFAIGDSYIHLAYARTLATQGQLYFNPGLREGIGSTSILWVLILSALYLLKGSLVLSTRILGIALLCLSGCLIYRLGWRVIRASSSLWRKILAGGASLLGVFSGSMVWTAQNGMETMLFIALGLLALELYAAERRILLGIALGLLALTRIEGVVLGGVILLVDLLRARRITAAMLKTALPLALMVLPWLGYLQLREGMPTTSSLVARQYYFHEEESRLMAAFGNLGWLWKIPLLPYILLWVFWIAFFISGLGSLAGPSVKVDLTQIGTVLDVPVMGVIVGLIVALILGGSALRWLWSRRRAFTLKRPEHRLLLVFGLWMILHNLAYALLLPRTGAGGRYAPFNQILFWLMLGVGAYKMPSRKTRIPALICLAVLMGVSLRYWRIVYQENTKAMELERVAAARYVDMELPAQDAVGAIDMGVLRYYARQQIVDLAGHVNNTIIKYYEAGRSTGDYLYDKQLCYLTLHGPNQGVGLDIRHEMGLDADARFDLVQEAVFAISIEDWLLGVGPLQNYMPAVYVYRIDWHNESWCDVQLPTSQSAILVACRASSISFP
jgi:hypothetical protein